MSDTQQFLKTLFAPYHLPELRMEIRTLWPKSAGTPPDYIDRKTGELKPLTARSEWYKLSGTGGAERYSLDQARRWDVYIGVLPRAGYRRYADSIPTASFLWAEIDGKSEGQMGAVALLGRAMNERDLPRPTMLIGSGGGCHAYWQLQIPVPLPDLEERRMFVQVLRRLAFTIGGLRWDKQSLKPIDIDLPYADPTCCDVARILRIPGTINHKPDRMCEVELIGGPEWEQAATLDQWRSWLPAAPAPPDRPDQRPLLPGETLPLPPATIEKLNTVWPIGTRHEAFIKILASARRCGWGAAGLEAIGEELVRRNGADRNHVFGLVRDTLRRIPTT